MLIRMNSLIRGHSGVRWELIERMCDLLHANIVPLVPIRGSISASGGEFSIVALDPIFDRLLSRRPFTALLHSGDSHRQPFHTRFRWSSIIW